MGEEDMSLTERLGKMFPKDEPDLYNLNKIKVSFDAYAVHLTCPRTYVMLEAHDCYLYPLFHKFYNFNTNKYALKCISKFKKFLEKENDLMKQSFSINNALTEVKKLQIGGL